MCRVLVDGRLVLACSLPASAVDHGAQIRTFDGLASDPTALRAIAHFETERPTRCRLCVPALAVTAAHLAQLDEDDTQPTDGDDPTDEAIDQALGSLVCKCTGRGSLVRALRQARRFP
jgi:aldehyde oxidoreductase